MGRSRGAMGPQAAIEASASRFSLSTVAPAASPSLYELHTTNATMNHHHIITTTNSLRRSSAEPSPSRGRLSYP